MGRIANMGRIAKKVPPSALGQRAAHSAIREAATYFRPAIDDERQASSWVRGASSGQALQNQG